MSFIRIINCCKLELEPILDPIQSKRRAWATFLLIFMSMQYVMFEGYPLSWPKMITMSISPLVLIGLKITHFSKGLWMGMCYWLTICITSWIHPYAVNHTSIWFTFPFILLFGTYHTLLTYNVFSLKDFEKILLWVIGAYIFFLIAQQICYMIGIHTIGLFNRVRPLGFKFQSLGLEPSYSARLMGAYVFAYYEVLKLKHGRVLSLAYLWKNYRLQIYGIIYFFVTLGSGAGWGVFATLIAYIAWNRIGFSVIMALIIIFIYPQGYIEPLDRFNKVVRATLTLDIDNVLEVDQSAAYRVGVIFNFVKGFKPWLFEFWVGQGAYTHKFANIGIIMLYGFVSWMMQIALFMVCCFRKILSYEFFYFIIFVTLCVGNVVNLWAIMMVFSTLKYFYLKNEEEHNVR